MLIGSGPVGGLKGCEHLTAESGGELEMANVLATDMGGTSFELGIIRDGRPLVQEETRVQKYVYNIPKLDVESIGAGGGSMATVSDNRIEVGPESAGADPGPACYGRGGEVPTVTDADLYLGYIDPAATFGTGELSPSLDLAEEALSEAGGRLGQSATEFAAGIYEVTNTKMANLIEKNVIGRGYDPRDFSVMSYGGAGPIHASAYANKLDVDAIVVPGDISPVWSAYGILNTDIRQEVEQEVVHLQPFDAEAVEEDYRDLEARGREMLDSEGVDAEDVTFERYALMRFEGQYHELEIPAPATIEDAENLAERFESEYRQRYSAAALFSEARAEIQSIRVEPVVEVETFERATLPTTDEVDESAAKGTRDVYWPSAERTVETEVYDGTKLKPGNEIEGPTVVDMSNTAIVAQENQTVRQNRFRDFVIEVGGDGDGD
jgi:N-methylhydantoinase A